MPHFNILVLEGGGAKGPFEMGVLERLEDFAEERIVDFVDLIVATSVGSVIGSLICSNGRSAKEWAQIIIDELPGFFKKRGLFCLPVYDKKNYVKCYEKYCKKGMLMAELPIKFMVTSLDRCEPKIHFFKSWEEVDGQLPVVEATMRSFSAPYFFGATIDEQASKVWMDGGMGTDNLPLIESLIEALMQGWLTNGNTTHILAVGSGRSDAYVPFDKAKKSNIISQTVDQFKMFTDTADGGLARALSPIEQVRNVQAVAKKLSSLTFQFIDWNCMPKEFDKMDNVGERLRYYAKGLEEGLKIDISKFKL